MHRVIPLVVCAGCWSPSTTTTPASNQSRPGPRLVVAKLFDMQVNGPITDLDWRGTDSRVGGYQVGPCIVSYDAGMYQSGLEPNALGEPEEYRYRSRPLSNRPARWATWKKLGDAMQPGPYWAAVYVPGLQISVACAAADERDAGVRMLETTILTGKPRDDLAQVDPARGPADWTAAPVPCRQATGPAVGGFGDAVLRVESDRPHAQLVVILNGEIGQPVGPIVELRAPAGTYSFDVQDTGDKVRCTGIALVPGAVTTVRVRFDL